METKVRGYLQKESSAFETLQRDIVDLSAHSQCEQRTTFPNLHDTVWPISEVDDRRSGSFHMEYQQQRYISARANQPLPSKFLQPTG